MPHHPHRSLLAACLAACALATIALPSHAQAQMPGGLYLGLNLGANDLATQDIDRVGTPFGDQPTGNIKARTGMVYAASVGWRFGNGVRVEAELSERMNDFWQATAGALRSADADGKQKQMAFFVNALYDFNAQYGGFSPYVGIGLGRVSSKWDGVTAFKPGERVRFDDTERTMAYQLILGTSFLKDVWPGWSFNLEYRLVESMKDRTYSGRIVESRFGAFPVTVDIPGSRNHALLLGLRYDFGRP